MTRVVVKIPVGLRSTLALDRLSNERQISTFSARYHTYLTQHIALRKLSGDMGTEAAPAVLKSLDRLTQDEARNTAVQTLEVINGSWQHSLPPSYS